MFIDGLDEFDGRYDSVIKMITDVSDQRHVKICVSSRPLFAFEEAFIGNPFLRLQDLTCDTIREYVEKQLSDSVQRYVVHNRSSEHSAKRLLDMIVGRADGVFLWAVIATRVVHEGLQGMADLHELTQAIEVLPPELESLFMLVLQRIKPAFQRDAAKFLRIVLLAGRHAYFDLCRLYLISSQQELQDAPFVYENVARSELAEACCTLKIRLLSHTAGLLELTSRTSASQEYCKGEGWDPIGFTRVDFSHRTVREFLLDNDEAKSFLDEKGLSEAQVQLCIARGTLAHDAQLSEGDPVMVEWFRSHPMISTFQTVLSHIASAERLFGAAQSKFMRSLDYPSFQRRYTMTESPDRGTDMYQPFLKNEVGTSIDIVGMAAAAGMTIYVCEQLGLSLSSTDYCPSLPDLASYSTNRAAPTYLAWKMLDELPHAVSHGETLSRSHPYRHALGKCLRWDDGQTDNHSLVESYILCCCWSAPIALIRILLNAGANPMVQVRPIDPEPIEYGESSSFWFSWLCFLKRMREKYMDAHGKSGGMLFEEGHDRRVTLRDIFEVTKALLVHGADVNFQMHEHPSVELSGFLRRGGLAADSFILELSATAMFILEECFNNEPEFRDFALAVSPLIKRPTREIVRIWVDAGPRDARPGCHPSADDSKVLWPLIEKWERTGHHKDLTALQTAMEQIYNADGPLSELDDESGEEGGEESEAEATE